MANSHEPHWSKESTTTMSSNNDVSKPRPRKRRRAAGGAGEDCWTCQRRLIPCDRKRPYCTQCIEIGRECSGYKTTLSWGVGVASRGKLRGLACPVANKNVDGSDINPGSGNATTGHKRTASAVKKTRDGSNTAPVTVRATDKTSRRASTTASSRPLSIAPQLFLPPSTQPVAQSSMTMDYTAQQPGTSSDQRETHPLAEPNPEPSLYSPSIYQQEISPGFQLYKQLPSLVTYTPSVNQQSPITPMSGSTHMASESTPASRNESYHPAVFDMDEPMLNSAASYQQISYSPLDRSTSAHFHEPTEEWEERNKSLIVSNQRFSQPFFHVTPPLQALMEHYSCHVSPFLVAFDGANNPYRTDILQLAVRNEGLQNAIAALSSNNLRMRRKARRRFGYVTELPSASETDTPTTTSNEVAEESCYKQMAIDQLNLQLTDRSAAEDDSVLATLLILCLYHVCDSGFSKFRTQLAGVQKLLAFRNPQTHSDFTRWVQMFFTWFDVMTSTVNNREMEIKTDALSMLDFASNLGAMEQFSGCDGRLFKIIARLGRLNLLSQGRPVRPSVTGRHIHRDGSMSTSSMSATAIPGYMDRFGRTSSAKPSLSSADYHNIDGNGWGSVIITSPPSDSEMTSPPSSPSSKSRAESKSDGRDEFWTEWHEIRSHLRAFETSSTPISPATSPNISFNNPTKLQADQRDMMHINESFRCAALLYTERLGHPHRPSAHPSFQTLVTEALYHIESLSLNSCVHKFLLWPLFLVGTECVDDNQRNVVRTRCVEVQQESGFYNNLSTLDLLERVWADTQRGSRGGAEAEGERERVWMRDEGRQAFRWRRAMDRADGEYIII